jgi:phosphoglycerol transferase
MMAISRFSRSHPILTEGIYGIAAALISVVAFLRISGASFTQLGAFWGKQDAILEYATAKALQAMGWGNVNPSLGFPYGQDWSHFPALDALNRVELYVLGRFLDPISALNSLTILSYVGIPILMYCALRNLHVSRFFAVAGSVALTLIPYHFDYEHAALNNYLVVPVGIFWLSLLLNSDSAIKGYRRTALWIGILAGVVIGLSNSYYAVFFLLLGAVALIFRWRSAPDEMRLRARILLYAVPLFSFLAYQLFVRLLREIPASMTSANRLVEESYTWGGKFVSLFTIAGDTFASRNPANARLSESLVTSNWTGILASHSASVVAASLVTGVLVLVLIFGGAGNRSVTSRAVSFARSWAGLWLVTVGLFTTSGLGVIFAALVTPQIRVWQRSSVLIAALSVTVVAILATHASVWLKKHGSNKARAVRGALYLLAGLLVLDPLTGSLPAPIDAQTPATMKAFVRAGESQVGRECAVLSIPTQAFPEAVPRGSMLAYDLLLPYLFSNSWKYSYGAISSQLGSRWTDHLAIDPSSQAAQAKGLGFCALLVDAKGLDENSAGIDQYLGALGSPVSVADQRWYLFDLGRIAADESAIRLLTEPELVFGEGWASPEMNAEGRVTRWIDDSEAAFQVWNPSNEDSRLKMNYALSAGNCKSARTVEVHVGSVTIDQFSIQPNQRVERSLPMVVPGRGMSEIAVKASGGTCGEGSLESNAGVLLEDPRFTVNDLPEG